MAIQTPLLRRKHLCSRCTSVNVLYRRQAHRIRMPVLLLYSAATSNVYWHGSWTAPRPCLTQRVIHSHSPGSARPIWVGENLDSGSPLPPSPGGNLKSNER